MRLLIVLETLADIGNPVETTDCFGDFSRYWQSCWCLLVFMLPTN